jgi:hypothetical protein
MKFSGKLNPLIYYPIFIHNKGRTHRRLACMSKWLPYMHAYFEHIRLDISYPLPFLATALEMLVGISSVTTKSRHDGLPSAAVLEMPVELVSGTTIRGTQIKMENHPASPFKGKINKRETC